MLIILTKSPWSENYGSLLEIARRAVENGEKVDVLYIQDACIAATINEYSDKLAENEIEVYALKTDCDARGLTGEVSGRVKLIDFKQWVKLVMTEHKKIVSWTT